MMLTKQQNELRKVKWGYQVRSSSDECIAGINEFYDQVLIYGSRRKIIFEAAEQDKDCVTANVLAGWCASVTDRGAGARYLARALENADTASDYERELISTVVPTVEGRTSDALDAHSKLLKQYPADLVSLKRAQVICFGMGRPDIMLQFVKQVLPFNTDAAYIYGMVAFPLVELGKIDEAEAAARKGLEIEPGDVWAQHALCHVLQDKKLYEEAILFMEANSETWNACGSFLFSHCWWHLALCYLETGDLDAALNILDTRIWGQRDRGEMDVSQVILNALGLLLAIQLKGYGDYIVERTAAVTEYLSDEAKWNKEWLLDLLIVWALARCNNVAASKKLLSCMRSRVQSLASTEEVQKSLLALSSALHEYGTGNESAAAELLGPAFNALDLKVIGASNEQMQVFAKLWERVFLRG